MTHRWTVIAAFVILLSFISSTALAQHQHSATPTEPSVSQGQADQMQACQKHRSDSLGALDEAASLLEQAKQSADPQQAKTAIESAESKIAEVRHHLSLCPMVGDGSMDHSGMDHSQQQGHKMHCMSEESRPE